MDIQDYLMFYVVIGVAIVAVIDLSKPNTISNPLEAFTLIALWPVAVVIFAFKGVPRLFRKISSLMTDDE